MLEGVIGLKFGYILCGVIWSVVLGFAVGNYACSLVHRLPRGRLLLDKKPYCGHCGTMLQVRDLFPVFSALMLRHRCRYCGTPFPVSHTWTEVLVGLLFVLAYLQYNYSDGMVLICALGVFLITLAAIEANERMILWQVLLPVVVFGMLNRVLLDHSLFEFFNGGLIALVLGCLIWRKSIKPVAHIYIPPVQVQLMAVGGICVGTQGLLLFLPLFALFYGLFWLLAKARRSPVTLTVPFGLAVMIPVMYPKLLLILF